MVAMALSACHEEIATAARVGGDEFALIQIGPAEPQLIGQAILKLFDAPFKIGDERLKWARA